MTFTKLVNKEFKIYKKHYPFTISVDAKNHYREGFEDGLLAFYNAVRGSSWDMDEIKQWIDEFDPTGESFVYETWKDHNDDTFFDDIDF